MSSATLPIQEYKWPVFKVFSVLFLASLFLSGAGWWEVIFNQRVILPFASLLAAPLLYPLFRRDNPIWAFIAAPVLEDLNQTFPANSGAASKFYVDALVQDWGADPYTRGAYSYPTTKTIRSNETDTARLRLRAPVADKRIFLLEKRFIRRIQRLSLAQFMNDSPGNAPVQP